VSRDRIDAEHRQLQRVAVSADGDGVALVEDRALAPGVLLERRHDQHPLTDARRVHAGADSDDATDALRPQRRGQLRAHPVEAPDQHQIRRVDRRRLDRHLELAGAGIR
jgi:hypothetical protein